MMSNIIKQLRTEHNNMSKLLDLLEVQIDIFSQGEQADLSLMLDIINYMLSFPDLVHHPKEDLVFKKLIERDKTTEPLVEKLINEHIELTQKTKSFADTLNEIILEAMLTREKVTSACKELIALNRNHMIKEESEILPLAVNTLTSDDWDVIESSIPADDDPLFGKSVKNQYQSLYKAIMRDSI